MYKLLMRTHHPPHKIYLILNKSYSMCVRVANSGKFIPEKYNFGEMKNAWGNEEISGKLEEKPPKTLIFIKNNKVRPN